MYISNYHRVCFDLETEAHAAEEFKRRHPDWTEHINDGKRVAYTINESRKYKIISEGEIPEYDTEMLMPGIYIMEVE